MAIVNMDTYSLTVIWGKFSVPTGDSSTEITWCWHAIATHIMDVTPSPTVPTGWIDTTQENNRTETIECYADNWTDMSSKLALLATFWG